MAETDDWADRLAGARMQVDRRFEGSVEQSRFSNQEWGLIMTAVEFRVRNADQPTQARLVADTEHVVDIIPELDEIKGQMAGSPEPTAERSADGSVLGRLRQYLGFLGRDQQDTGPDEERVAAARRLVEEYTNELQSFLEEQDRWDDLCAAAADQS